MRYSKKKILQLLEEDLIFTRHALEQMVLSSRRLTEDEVEDAIRRGSIIEVQKSSFGDRVVIQAYKPTVCVVLGVSDYLVVITTWRGVKK
jgi:hypothetical protein